MDWIILILLIASIFHTEWRYRSYKTQLRHEAGLINSHLVSRMGSIRFGQRSVKDPDVEVARTTTRDTNDIPPTGRMSGLMPQSNGGDLHE
jgi:hypothetical protein